MGEEKKYSETHDQFGFEIALKHICYLIERRGHLSKDSGVYIEWAKDYLESANQSLNGIINDKEGPFPPTPYLERLVKCAGKVEKGLSKKDALEVKSKIDLLNDNLDRLNKNPQAFYQTKVSKEMWEFFTNFLSMKEKNL